MKLTFACMSCCFTCWDQIFWVSALLCPDCCSLPLHGSLFYSAVQNLSLKGKTRLDACTCATSNQLQMQAFGHFFFFKIALLPSALVHKLNCNKRLQEIAKANSKVCSKTQQADIAHKRTDVAVGLQTKGCVSVETSKQLSQMFQRCFACAANRPCHERHENKKEYNCRSRELLHPVVAIYLPVSSREGLFFAALCVFWQSV